MLVLLRHGESAANAEGRLLGRSEAALTENGRRQAAALGTRLGPVVRLVSSPLGRAVETAERLGLDLPVEVDERWVEIDYGELDGRPLAEVPAELWRSWRADPGHRPPGGESLTAVGRRVSAALDELFARAGAGARRSDGDVVVVSHVSPIKAAVAWALGCGDEVAWRLHLSTGSLSRVDWSNSLPLLETYNERPVLSPS